MARSRKQLKDDCWEKERGNTEQKSLKVAQFLCFTTNYIWNGGVGSCLTEMVAEVGCVLYYIRSTLWIF